MKIKHGKKVQTTVEGINLIDQLKSELITMTGDLTNEEKSELMKQFIQEQNIASGLKIIMHNQAVLKSVICKIHEKDPSSMR